MNKYVEQYEKKLSSPFQRFTYILLLSQQTPVNLKK